MKPQLLAACPIVLCLVTGSAFAQLEAPPRSLDDAWQSPQDGNQTLDPACGIPGVCTDGWRGSSAEPLIAIGGYVRNNVGIGKMAITLDGDPTRRFESPQALVISTIFIGVIDPAGFTEFEFRELKGKNEDQFFIFAALMLGRPSLAPDVQPLEGGALYAFPYAQQFLFSADSAGVSALSLAWPPGIPAATSFWIQFLMQDTTASGRLVLSNGVRGVAP